MKNMLFPFIAAVSILTSCSTSRETSRVEYSRRAPQSYYYYPSANVYYDGSCSRYIYNNGRSWVTASILPSGFSIGNDRVQINYNGADVWRDNDRHRRDYYRQPVVVDNRWDDKKWKKEEKRKARYRERRYDD
ncbi:MAG TPA: hypothetical protein VKH37_07290 [Ferruginibacter sp.]|nr:hypothetical protein [Ferruginibacter sp.]